MHHIFAIYLENLVGHEQLQQRLLTVLGALPGEVQRDFLDDPRFRVAMEDYIPGKGWRLWMDSPGPIGNGSRPVVLRPRLGECSLAFAHYVIAHEFAHAYLRNGPWEEILDAEAAADALALPVPDPLRTLVPLLLVAASPQRETIGYLQRCR